MSSTMTFYSTALLAAKMTLQMLHLQHRHFTCAFAEKFYEQLVALIQSRSYKLY